MLDPGNCSQEDSGLKRWALGNVADKVLHATTTSLLLVRAQPER